MSLGEVETWSGKIWTAALTSMTKSSDCMSCTSLYNFLQSSWSCSLCIASFMRTKNYTGHNNPAAYRIGHWGCIIQGQETNYLLKDSSGVDCVWSLPSHRNCRDVLRCLFSGNVMSTSRASAISLASVWQAENLLSLKLFKYVCTPWVSFLSVSRETLGLWRILLTWLIWYKTDCTRLPHTGQTVRSLSHSALCYGHGLCVFLLHSKCLEGRQGFNNLWQLVRTIFTLSIRASHLVVDKDFTVRCFTCCSQRCTDELKDLSRTPKKEIDTTDDLAASAKTRFRLWLPHGTHHALLFSCKILAWTPCSLAIILLPLS